MSGSDKLKQDLIDVTVVEGEQPDATKLTNVFRQFKRGLEYVGKAVGDVWNSYGSSFSAAPLSTYPLSNSNLSRMMGSANWLNPRHISRIRTTRTVLFIAGRSDIGTGGSLPSVGTIDGFSQYNTRIFRLPFPPIYFVDDLEDYEGIRNYRSPTSRTNSWDTTPGGWTISAPPTGAGIPTLTDATASGSGKVVTRVNNLSDLNATGEYHVSDDGVITLYDHLDPSGNPEAFQVTYIFHTLWDSFDGATQNVIPDFEQLTSDGLCSVVASVSPDGYIVTLPLAKQKREGYFYENPDPSGTTVWSKLLWPWKHISWSSVGTSGTTGVQTDPMMDNRLKLPMFIASATYTYPTGTSIPEGYLALWHESSQTIVSGGTYWYYPTGATHRLFVQNVTLEEGTDKYRIVCPGADLANTLAQLRESYFNHDHSGQFWDTLGLYTGNRIHHYDTIGLIDEGTATKDGFTVSSIGPNRNPHPQYLHRYGYQYDESISDTVNVDNAMLGDLVISQDDDTLANSDDSHAMRFGSATGPSLFYDESEDSLEITAHVHGGGPSPASLALWGIAGPGLGAIAKIYNDLSSPYNLVISGPDVTIEEELTCTEYNYGTAKTETIQQNLININNNASWIFVEPIAATSACYWDTTDSQRIYIPLVFSEGCTLADVYIYMTKASTGSCTINVWKQPYSAGVPSVIGTSTFTSVALGVKAILGINHPIEKTSTYMIEVHPPGGAEEVCIYGVSTVVSIPRVGHYSK